MESASIHLNTVTVEPMSSTETPQTVCNEPYAKFHHHYPTPELSDSGEMNPEIDNIGSHKSVTKPPLIRNQIGEDGTLQCVFEEEMKEVGGPLLPHRKAAVLMISWAEGLDDLNTTNEVDRLGAVFKNHLNYQVVKTQIAYSKHPSQRQVQRFLLDFVEKYDDPSALLIVYYAGHGIPGRQELELAGKRVPGKESSRTSTVFWSQVEHTIRDTKAEILLIFDCCYAGALSHGVRDLNTRPFEFLGACGPDDTTRRPGKESFTSALIWALKDLVLEKGCFTTLQLHCKIMEAPEFPKGQHPHLCERDDPSYRRLVLGPIPKPEQLSDNQQYTTANSTRDGKEKEFLDIRLFYEDLPNTEDIRELAQELTQMIKGKKVKVSRIVWLSLSGLEKARWAASVWKERTTAAIRKKHLQLSIPTKPKFAQGLITPDESPSPVSDASDLQAGNTEHFPRSKIYGRRPRKVCKDVAAIVKDTKDEQNHGQKLDSPIQINIRVEDFDDVMHQRDRQHWFRMTTFAVLGATVVCLPRSRPAWAPLILLGLVCIYIMYLSAADPVRTQKFLSGGDCSSL